jgi:hypothetical protein
MGVRPFMRTGMGTWRKLYDRKQILASYTIPPRERN